MLQIEKHTHTNALIKFMKQDKIIYTRIGERELSTDAAHQTEKNFVFLPMAWHQMKCWKLLWNPLRNFSSLNAIEKYFMSAARFLIRSEYHSVRPISGHSLTTWAIKFLRLSVFSFYSILFRKASLFKHTNSSEVLKNLLRPSDFIEESNRIKCIKIRLISALRKTRTQF